MFKKKEKDTLKKTEEGVKEEVVYKTVRVWDRDIVLDTKNTSILIQWLGIFKPDYHGTWLPPMELIEKEAFLEAWLDWLFERVYQEKYHFQYKRVVEELIQKVGIENLSSESLILKGCRIEPKVLNWIPKHWRAMPGFDRKCIDANLGCVIYANETQRSDRELMLKAVQTHGEWLYYTTEALREDQELVLEAVKSAGASVLQWVNIKLLEDVDFLLKCIELDPNSYSYALGPARKSERCIELSVSKNPECLQYVKEEWINESIAKKALKANALCYQWLPEHLKKTDTFIGLVLRSEPQLWDQVPQEKKMEELWIVKMWEQLLGKNLNGKLRLVIDSFEDNDIPKCKELMGLEKRIKYARYLSSKISPSNIDHWSAEQCKNTVHIQVLEYLQKNTDALRYGTLWSATRKSPWGLEVWSHLLEVQELLQHVNVDEVLKIEPWYLDRLEEKTKKQILEVAKRSQTAIVLGKEGQEGGSFSIFLRQYCEENEEFLEKGLEDKEGFYERVWGLFVSSLEQTVLVEDLGEDSTGSKKASSDDGVGSKGTRRL